MLITIIFSLFIMMFGIGLLSSIFITPVLFSMGLMRLSNENYKLSKQDKQVMLIPFYNIFYANSIYKQRNFSLTLTGYILAIVAVVQRGFCIAIASDSVMVQNISIILMLVLLLAYWFMCSLDVFLVLRDVKCITMFAMIFISIVFMIGQTIIGMYVSNMVYYYSQEVGDDLYD